jgi:hypothetical protein
VRLRAFAKLYLVRHQCGVRARRCDRQCRCRHDRDLLDQLRPLFAGGERLPQSRRRRRRRNQRRQPFYEIGGERTDLRLVHERGAKHCLGLQSLGWRRGAPSVVLGGGSATRTIFGRVFSGQQTVPAGSYLSAFSGMDASINVNCSGPATTTTFNVTATPAHHLQHRDQ